MNIVSLEEAKSQIKKYLTSPIRTTYLVGVNDSSCYKELLKEFSGIRVIRISDYCGEDSFPDIDAFFSNLKTAAENVIVVGVGDTVNLGYSASFLGKLKDMYISTKTIVLCKGVDQNIKNFVHEDSKFVKNRYCLIDGQLDYEIISVAKELSLNNSYSLKKAFRLLEDGFSGKLYVSTDTVVNSGYFIDSAYEAIRLKYPSFNIPREALDDNQWREYYYDDNLDNYDLTDWRTYVSFLVYSTDNVYMKEVLKRTSSYMEYKTNLINVLLDFNVKDKQFNNLYRARKILIEDFAEYDIQSYIKESMTKGKEAIYYLTDNTELEKVQIIKLITEYKFIPDNLELIYKDLSDYMYAYKFHNTENDSLYNEYFAEYKRLKLLNYVSDDFGDTVAELAEDGNRKYHEFDARNSIVEKYNTGSDYLIWIDGLGVEYLGFIVKKSKEIGLSIKIRIGQAILPSLTSVNREFFDDWKGPKEKDDMLDSIIHDGLKGYNIKPSEAPVHIIKQLDIIFTNLKRIKSKLVNDGYNFVLLSSDHGASRLAVIKNSENIYTMNEPGQHSGRCCLASSCESKPVSATQNKNFWVLANYDRFKGGRKANVEVHGGATLEEVIVPTIVFSLPTANEKYYVKNLTGELEKRMGKAPEIDIECNAKCDTFNIQCNSNTYYGKKTREKTYHFTLDGIKKQGEYLFECFADDTLIGELNVYVQSSVAKKSNSDDFFDI